MVDTTMFILQLIGLAVIVFWAITNDRPGGEKSGLLAMRGTSAVDENDHVEARRGYRSGLMPKYHRVRRTASPRVSQEPASEQ